MPQGSWKHRPECQETFQSGPLGPESPEIDGENILLAWKRYDTCGIAGYEDESVAPLGAQSILKPEHERREAGGTETKRMNEQHFHARPLR